MSKMDIEDADVEAGGSNQNCIDYGSELKLVPKNADSEADSVEISSLRSAGKHSLIRGEGEKTVCRSLFVTPDEECTGVLSKRFKASNAGLPEVHIPKYTIAQVALTKERFAFEGKVLNIYGTFDTNKNFKKYLRTDLADEVGFGTITLVFGPDVYKQHLSKVIVGRCLRVEGATVVARQPNDGGSVDFSLQVDATTSIVAIETFETCVFFIPELSIRGFLNKVSTNANLKSTIAFVIVQVDHVQKTEGGLFEQLTIVDGPLPTDRATLTFVSKRKSLYYQLVDEFQKGTITPYVARNVGAWKDKPNTLSVLDITLLMPLYGERRKKELLEAFDLQISNQGYGKEIFGVFTITNFNGTLLVKRCKSCKGQNLNILSKGAFCYSCGTGVEVEEVIKLLGEVKQATSTSKVILLGDACDMILRFEEPILALYKHNTNLTRVRLSEISVEGHFIVDAQGQVFGFRPTTQA